jgi:hypothetical protein
VNEPIQTPSGWTKINATVFTKLFTTTTTETFSFFDLVGNQGQTGIQITRIDKTPPEVLLLDYTPNTLTTSGVVITFITNKLIHRPLGRSGNTIDTTFTRTYYDNISTELVFLDILGNQGQTGILIDRIRNADLLTGRITYTPATPTS